MHVEGVATRARRHPDQVRRSGSSRRGGVEWRRRTAALLFECCLPCESSPGRSCNAADTGWRWTEPCPSTGLQLFGPARCLVGHRPEGVASRIIRRAQSPLRGRCPVRCVEDAYPNAFTTQILMPYAARTGRLAAAPPPSSACRGRLAAASATSAGGASSAHDPASPAAAVPASAANVDVDTTRRA